MSSLWWTSDEDVDLECHPSELNLRIWQERARLGHTRKQWSELTGISVQRLKSLETCCPKRSITTVELAYMGGRGADVSYILNGKRTITLAPDEATLLDNYRSTTPQRKASLREVGAAFAQPPEVVKTTNGGLE